MRGAHNCGGRDRLRGSWPTRSPAPGVPRGICYPGGRPAVIGATALLIAGVAVAVVRSPNKLVLSLARGIAIVMIVGLAGLGLLTAGFLILLLTLFEGLLA